MKDRARQTSEWLGMKKFESQAINSGGRIAWSEMKDAVMVLAKQYHGMVAIFWFLCVNNGMIFMSSVSFHSSTSGLRLADV